MQIQITHKLGNSYWRMKDNKPVQKRLVSIQVEVTKPLKNPDKPWVICRTKQETWLRFEDDEDQVFLSTFVFKTKKALLASL